jgi:tripartite-type tricarboxylate transporter receptor subunit TctC
VWKKAGICMPWLRIVFIACCVFAHPAAAADFYADKVISISTHAAPGGGYDTYLRAFAAHFGKHIAGNPTVIVVNQPGAGGLTAINYAGRIAPRDGTFLTLANEGILFAQATGGKGLQASLDDFHWIGNFVKSNVVIVTWYRSPVKNLAGAKLKQATLGTTGVGAESDQIPLLVNALIGTKSKLIRGYEGAAQINAAMERGELDGRGANLWASYKAINPNEIRDHKFNYIVQLGTEREPNLADVPLLSELVKGDARKEAIVRFVTLANENARPVAAPPGVPPERVNILRRAFDETMRDTAFLGDARRLRLEITPRSGDEVQRSVHQVLTTAPEIIRETAAVMGANQR